MFGRRRVQIDTARLVLRLPVHSDFRAWSTLRRDSAAFLVPWEPAWAPDHLARKAFTNRVYWSARAHANGTALPLFLIRREDGVLVGAITLDNIRRGPAQCGVLGYWVGQPFARQGYMREAINGVVIHAFTDLNLSRIEAACQAEADQPGRAALGQTLRRRRGPVRPAAPHFDRDAEAPGDPRLRFKPGDDANRGPTGRSGASGQNPKPTRRLLPCRRLRNRASASSGKNSR